MNLSTLQTYSLIRTQQMLTLSNGIVSSLQKVDALYTKIRSTESLFSSRFLQLNKPFRQNSFNSGNAYNVDDANNKRVSINTANRKRGSNTNVIDVASPIAQTEDSNVEEISVMNAAISDKLKMIVNTAESLTSIMNVISEIPSFAKNENISSGLMGFTDVGVAASTTDSISNLPHIVLGSGVMTEDSTLSKRQQHQERLIKTERVNHLNKFVVELPERSFYQSGINEMNEAHRFSVNKSRMPDTPIGSYNQYDDALQKYFVYEHAATPIHNNRLNLNNGVLSRGNQLVALVSNSFSNVNEQPSHLMSVRQTEGRAESFNTVYDMLHAGAGSKFRFTKEEHEVPLSRGHSRFSEYGRAVPQRRVPDNSGFGGQASGAAIHFNKPLIDHFTINVKNEQQLVHDLKRKVEEVLIEILNNLTH